MRTAAHRYLLDNRDRHWWHVGKHAFITGLLRSFRLKRPAVLDIGSSYAFLSDLIAHGMRIVSLDRDFDVLRTSRTPFTVCADAKELPFPSGSFDLVTALDLLEHVREDSICLREAVRTLRPGGTIVVMVPAYRVLWSDLDEIGNHMRRYTPGGLRRLFESIPGVRIVKFSHFNFFLFPPIFIIRICQRLLKRVSPGLRTESMRTPPRVLNNLLKRIFLLEGRFAVSHQLPVGVSLVAVAVKET